MSQSRDDNRSNSHVHYCTGILFNIYYIFTCKYIICVKYSDSGTPMRNCTWLLLLLSPHVCDSFQCWCSRCVLQGNTLLSATFSQENELCLHWKCAETVSIPTSLKHLSYPKYTKCTGCDLTAWQPEIYK